MRSVLVGLLQKGTCISAIFCLFLNTAAASGSDLDAQEQCDRLAGPIPLIDPATQGRGVDFNRINVAEALPMCKRAAQHSSDPRYLALYSLVLRAGRNYPEAIKQAEKAADQGSTLAMINLGEAYEHGQGVPQSSVDSLNWYRKAADQGNAFAMSVVGEKYMSGEGVAQSDAEAAVWLGKAADSGLPNAMVNLGYLYELGRGVPQSYEKAEDWYRKAALLRIQPAAGSAWAHLGYLFETGHGVQQSDREAAAWYLRAAQSGNGPSMFNLAIHYQTGRGVSQDFGQAAVWYQRAADQHVDQAKLFLGVLYQNGWGVRRDFHQAEALFESAASSSNPEVRSAAPRFQELLKQAKAEDARAIVQQLVMLGIFVGAGLANVQQHSNGSDNGICAAHTLAGKGNSAFLDAKAQAAGCPFP